MGPGTDLGETWPSWLRRRVMLVFTFSFFIDFFRKNLLKYLVSDDKICWRPEPMSTLQMNRRFIQ